MKLSRKQQSIALFVILFIHFTVMDLFVVTTSEAKILIEEAMRVETIAVHMLAALLATFLYIAINMVRDINVNRDILVGDRVWFVCSVALLGMIGLFMM